MRPRHVLPFLLVATGVVAGLAAALVEPVLYGAETTLVIQKHGVTGEETLARSFAQLVRSDVVLRNVDQQLATHVSASRLHATPGAGTVVLAYDAGSRVEAARVVQQVAVDFGDVAAGRFGGAQATVFDPPHSVGRVSPHVARDLLLGLLAGLVLGAIAWRRSRVKALRERGRWRVSALAALVEQAAASHPDEIEDWRAHVAVLHAQAEDDLLPYAFDAVVRDVFAPLLPGQP